MRDKIIVTTLLEGLDVMDWRYYFSRSDSGKTLYCNALTPTEASCKYMLAAEKINKIVIIGAENVVRAEDQTGPTALSDGKSLFDTDPENFSAYDLLRYRLAEYTEKESGIDYSDRILSDEEKEKVVSFLNRFFEDNIQNESDRRPDLYFHLLAQNTEMQKALDEALSTWVPEEDHDRYRYWAVFYLYEELDSTYKMEPREDNTDIKIMLAVLKEDESIEFPKQIMETMGNDSEDSDDEADIYLCIQNTEASMILDVFNMINMTRVFPGGEIRVSKTITTNCRQEVLANRILDVTTLQNMSELFSGVEAFLKYGKTDIMVQYWKKSNIENPLIDRIMYAMRNIDNGISLCDISDIERGIRSLRDIIKSDVEFEGNTPIEEALVILLEGVRRDYGRLLETDDLDFIEMVKWAYRKEFWQQTLTLIESRAPGDFVKRGFYFYCDREENKDKVLNILAHIYNDFKPYERYKMEDVSHYYVKFYNRMKTSNEKRGKERMRDYASCRVAEIDSNDDREIRACSVCDDRKALEDLFYAYDYVGKTRNSTNHAMDSSGRSGETIDDADDSKRMETIRESVEDFLKCYDNVAKLVEGKDANVVTITYDEVRKCANELYRQSYKDGGRYRNNKNWSGSRN